MLTIAVIYEPTTRQISLPRNSDSYGGATIDSSSVEISVRGIDSENYSDNFQARVDFAVNIQVEGNKIIRPFVMLEKSGDEWKCVVPTDVLMATAKTRKLPFQLVFRDGDVIVNSRNTITLDITRAIDAMDTLQEAYGPYIMLRDDSWVWMENFTYKKGSVVTYDGYIYVSLVDNNLGNVPDVTNLGPYWKLNIAGDAFTAILGNGNDREFTINHDLNAMDVTCTLQKDGEFVFTTVKVVDEDNVKVIFRSPPEINSIRAVITRGGLS